MLTRPHCMKPNEADAEVLATVIGLTYVDAPVQVTSYMRLHRTADVQWKSQHHRLAEWDRNTSSTRHNKNLVHNRDYLGIFRISSLSDIILLLWASLNIIVSIDFIDQDSFVQVVTVHPEKAPHENYLVILFLLVSSVLIILMVHPRFYLFWPDR